jgi:hypothetical protein
MRQESPDNAGKSAQRDRLSVLREGGVHPAEHTARYDVGASLDLAAQRLSSASEPFSRPHQASFRAFYQALHLIIYFFYFGDRFP